MTARHKTGLTLIEVMAALVIVSMLTVTALAIVSNLSREDTAERRRHEASLYQSSLRDALEMDMLHATQRGRAADGILVRTGVSLDEATMETRHLGATVRYRAQTLGSRHWLVRTEQMDDAAHAFSELVCPGVKAIRLPAPTTAPAPDGGAPAGNGSAPAADANAPAADWENLPQDIEITVEFDSGEPAVYVFRRE